MRRALLALTLGILSASCNNNDTPTGTAGSVTVHAFVDADGSGTFTTGDVAVPGSVTLSSESGATRDATLDASGTAVFDNVTPGSYTVALNGTPPAGAILGGAMQPTVVIPFAGRDATTEFRYVYNPGSVNGVLFRDNNSNGTFDAGTDTPAAGMSVSLFTGTDTTKAPVATTTTGSGGDFHFGTVRPGSYTVVIDAIPTIQIVGGTTQTVNVTAASSVSLPVRFTGSLVTPIADVRNAALGSTVAFVGVAEADAGLLASNNLYVQDATGGVLVFGSPTAGIVAGDSVRVIGALTSFNDELEVAAPKGGTLTVTKLGHVATPSPRSTTIPQLVSNTYAGQLVRVSGAKVVSTATTGATSYNVNLVGSAPADTFQVRIGNTNTIDIPITFWRIGGAYDITGVNGVFKGEAQLKPRSAADVQGASTSTSLTIAQARTHPAGDTVAVVGVVYAGTGVYTAPTASSLNAYIQDTTGGTQIFNVPSGTTLTAGDSVRVRGIVSIFNGEFEIVRFSSTSPLVVDVLGKTTPPAARTITETDLASRAYDGQLVRVAGLTVKSVGTPSSSGGYNVVTTAPNGTSITVRVDNASTGIASTSWTVGQTYDVSGAALNFSSNGTTFTPEIKPRSPADVSVSAAGVKTIAEAKKIANDTVTVEGIVTAAPGTFNTAKSNAYIQDATSGVQIFNLPATLNLSLGDAVRVHGKMTVFNGENEITNNGNADSISVTKLGPGGTPAPRVLTGAEFLSRTFEGQLVTLQNVTITTVGTAGSTGTYTVTGTTPDGSSITIFMSAPAGAVPTPASTFVVGNKYNITGIASVFSNAAELKPRGAFDVVTP
jgi:DNA/RNA endonuclease YhcR with UshA esterase domain